MGDADDSLWPHFKPLWTDLQVVSPKIVLAGGYGLFLKQKFLLSGQQESGNFISVSGGQLVLAEQQPTLIDVARWANRVRATKDFDFVVNLELIASKLQQAGLVEALKRQGFEEVTENRRWQFSKRVADNQNVLVDFHCPAPGRPESGVRVKNRRVMHESSLGDRGIHGRENPEALGADLSPFVFPYQGATLSLPHPVTYSVMKLIAARDQRHISQDLDLAPEQRRRSAQQAEKHAEDFVKILAMTTRAENDAASGVAESLRETEAFVDALKTYETAFAGPGQWGHEIALRDGWTAGDLQEVARAIRLWA